LNHFTHPDFWTLYHKLPRDIRRRADAAYALLRENPRHPSVHFKKVGALWSARVTLDYRALAVEAPDGFVWFWVGRHDEYEKIIG
jgi:hypothetical protein